MASHGISRTEFVQSRNEQVREKERKKLKEYNALVAETQEGRLNCEYSSATLRLTSKVLKINPEFYTIWNYRRQILLQIEFIPFVETLQTAQTKLDQPKPIPSDTNKGVEEEEVYGAYETRVASLLKDELQFLVPLLTTFPKCYWIWNHRLWTLHQASVLMSADKAILFWTQELALVGMMLTRDMRNFHGWMYRRLIVANLEEISQGNMVQQEFDYTSKMVRGVGGMTNYSAWHQRSVLFPRLILENGCDEQERMDLLEDELELLQRAISTDPEDQSLWYYHRWLVYSNTAVKDGTAIAPGMAHATRMLILQDQIDVVKEVLEANPECKYALYALVLYVRRLQNLRKELENNYALHGDCVDIITADDDSENKNIREWLQILETIDPMRAGRYKYLGKNLCP